MTEKNKQTAVVILSYNVRGELFSCLKSLETADGSTNILKIVVDNHSTDGSAGAVKKVFPKAILISNQENLGYAGGNNVGVKVALEKGADYIFILNPDTEVAKNIFAPLGATLKNSPQAGIVGPKIYFAPGYEFHADRYQEKDLGKVLWWAGGKMDWENVMTKHLGVDEIDKGQYGAAGETETIPGTAMFVRKEVFARVGFFDEKYFLYFEESDFCQRAGKAGFKLWYEPKAVVWHKNARSSGVGSPLHDYYITRNRLLFGWRYAPVRSKIALGKEAVKMLFSGREWQRKGARDFLLGQFGKGSYLG